MTSNKDSEIDTENRNVTITEPRETFNVEPLSTEEEMDAVDALLSLQDLRDDSVDQPTENETLMPIGGGNLPVDVALVPIELNQVQVDHAIAKMTEQQQEEEAATERVADKNNVTPTENISGPAPSGEDTDAKGSSPLAKGVFKTNAHTSVVFVEPGSPVCTC